MIKMTYVNIIRILRMIYEDLISMFDILYTRLKSPKVQGRDLICIVAKSAMGPTKIFQWVLFSILIL